jgi:hypothetical protein
MPDIVVNSASLYQDRRRAVRRLVAPLLPQPPNVIVEQVGLGRNAYTIGVLPYGRSPSAYLNPEDALVATRVPNLLMNYYESWRLGTESDNYYLDRVYLHIHLTKRSSSRQIFSLHCDPSLNSSEAHFRYKRGPHVHIEGADPDVSRAHISLCLTDHHLGGADLLALMSSFDQAVRMVAAELFPSWEQEARGYA